MGGGVSMRRRMNGYTAVATLLIGVSLAVGSLVALVAHWSLAMYLAIVLSAWLGAIFGVMLAYSVEMISAELQYRRQTRQMADQRRARLLEFARIMDEERQRERGSEKGE